MDMPYGGLIELLVVGAFAIGWGILELVGLRLDKKRKNQSQPSSEHPRHPER
jgi:hypothetical protein